MSILPNNNYSRSHPSLFQTPAMDIQRFEVMDHAKTANPNSFWTIPVIKTQAVGTNGTGNHFRYDPRDPPFTSQEREEIVRKLKPIALETLSNAMPTLLFYFFFSEENIKTLQKNIRYTVNKYSGFNVGDASLIELRVLMDSIFVANAQHIDEHSAPSSVLLKHIRAQLIRLDDLVVNEAVPIVINGAEQHMGYLKRVDNPMSSESLQRPMDTSIAGTKVYRSLTDVLGATS